MRLVGANPCTRLTYQSDNRRKITHAYSRLPPPCNMRRDSRDEQPQEHSLIFNGAVTKNLQRFWTRGLTDHVEKQEGALGSVVVKALCYKPEGLRFDTRLGEFLNLPNPSGRTRPQGLLSL
jgi:hypothetical protein